MSVAEIILNEREARDARATAAEIERALSSQEFFTSIVAGIPLEVIHGFQRALRTESTVLKESIAAYERAKTGDVSKLVEQIGSDPGFSLIVARLAKGYTQKELARRLGLKEQQIQRYEADRYRSINLSNFKRIAHALGVRLEVKISPEYESWFGHERWTKGEYGRDEIRKIFKHAKENNWFKVTEDSDLDEKSDGYIERYINDHFQKYGSPALLRTGLNVENLSNDLALVAWRARVTQLADAIIQSDITPYKCLDISWLPDLVKLSQFEDGPIQAKEMLLSRGIVLVAEPQIAGLKLDGAAFLVDGVPVIGMTLRRDTLDNFWFTLLHEIAHVILHYRMGLGVGFFDDTERTEVDELEQEANIFASNLLIPNERWKGAAARVAKSPEPIERLAHDLKIHPAIVFGRIQKERDNYAIFSDRIGRGLVRKLLL